MLSFECIKNEKSVYFLLTSANLTFLHVKFILKCPFYGNHHCFSAKNPPRIPALQIHTGNLRFFAAILFLCAFLVCFSVQSI